MNKILLIISREYLSRVKKKSFIVLTFVVPLLIMIMYAGVIFLIADGDKLSGPRSIVVVDESGIFENQFKNDATTSYLYSNSDIETAKEEFKNSKNDYLLQIPPIGDEKRVRVQIFSEKQPGIALVSSISDEIELVLRDKKLKDANIDTAILNNLSTRVSIDTKKLTEEGEKDASTIATFGIGLVCAFLIYLFIFLYGVQVMRGVIEEKTNRIVEVIISSVRPFQLMMGKIIGIAMVGLTQFLLWVILSLAVTSVVGAVFVGGSKKDLIENVQNNTGASEADIQAVQEIGVMENVMKELATINFPFILGCFIFYFLGGYLMYSALFAAIGSAVDNETETQQFMLPITIPLIFAFIISVNVVPNAPDSALAFWLSIIPLTSPVVMMVRIAYDVPTWELLLSMGLLIAGFVFTVWIAGRIYRTGILMYGKKVTFKELGKWLFYK